MCQLSVNLSFKEFHLPLPNDFTAVLGFNPDYASLMIPPLWPKETLLPNTIIPEPRYNYSII